MSVEHQPRPSESNEHSQSELEGMAKEQLEKLQSTPENSHEHAEKRAEAAREVINKQQDAPEEAPQEEKAAAPRQTLAAHLDHVLNYTQTMASVQRKLTPVSRSFSKVIHTPVVEKTSEALERTVMRPSVVAGATWTAFLTGLVFYLVARSFGFPLSGSEMLAALLGGAVLGIVFEGLARVIRRRRI